MCRLEQTEDARFYVIIMVLVRAKSEIHGSRVITEIHIDRIDPGDDKIMASNAKRQGYSG
jgi:hypothetical protein